MIRIGVVLGAGGVVGHAFHAGVLSALEEVTGWDPRRAEVIVGTSAGSIVAAMLRAGFSAADLARRAQRQRLSAAGALLDRRAAELGRRPLQTPRPRVGRSPVMASPARMGRALLEPWRVRPGSLAAAVLPTGRRPTDPVSAPFWGLFGEAWSPDPLWIVAVELDRGRRVVFGRSGDPSTSVPQAVAASCAIPGYFQPVAIDDTRYVDGGAHSPSNVDVLLGAPLDLVIVSSPMSANFGSVRVGLDLAVRGAAGLALAREVAGLRRHGADVVTFEPTVADQRVMAGNALDPAKLAPVCAHVRASTRDRLRRDRLRPLLASLAGA